MYMCINHLVDVMWEWNFTQLNASISFMGMGYGKGIKMSYFIGIIITFNITELWLWSPCVVVHGTWLEIEL